MDLWIACELVQASVTMVHVLRAAGSLTASFTVASCNTAINNLITALKAYGLIS